MKTILTLLILSVANSNSCREQRSTNVQHETAKIDSKEVVDPTNQYFSLLEATSQEWFAGIRSGGRGTDYFIKIEVATSENLEFDTLWMNGRAYDLFVSKESSGISSKPVEYREGDVIGVRASEVHYEHDRSVGFSEQESPVSYTGAALLGFLVNNTRFYSEIPTIEQIEPSYRP